VNSRRISQNKKLIRITVIAVGCILVILLMPKLVNIAVAIVVAPINISKTWVTQSASSLPQYFRNRSELIHEISSLKADLSAVSGDRSTVQILARENVELRSLLGYEGEERVLAGVIGRSGVLPYDSLMLDRGTKNGVVNGAPVYIGENNVIGIIKNATTHTSLVELVTTPAFKTTVYIMGPDIYTNAVGMGGGQMRVGVPQGIVLSEGDLVVLPSVTSGVYGAVSYVQSEASRPEQYGYVSPKIPIASIRLVAIGKTPLQSISFEEAQAILEETKSTVFTVPVPDDILVDTESGTTSSSSADSQEIYEE
jgi:cell shape-determining protein MreC